MKNLTGSSMVLFSSLCVAYFGIKKKLKILTMGIFEGIGQYESIFEPIDLIFGIYIYRPYMHLHDTHIVRFF